MKTFNLFLIIPTPWINGKILVLLQNPQNASLNKYCSSCFYGMQINALTILLAVCMEIWFGCFVWLLYRIDFDVLGTSINAEQNPEAKEQIEKIRTLTVSIHQEEVKSLRILQHWDVFIHVMSSRFSCFKILRCTCRYCKCNTGIISFIFFIENS